MLTALKSLLASIVDYAGLFPPAQLSLRESLSLYNQARSSPYCWLLDRFVVPATRLHELVQLLPSLPEMTQSAEIGQSFQPWSLSVILSQNWAAELEHMHSLIAALPRENAAIVIRSLEVAPLPPTEIQQVSQRLPAEVMAFFEIPFHADLEPYLKILHQTGAAAKLRTGGVTPEAFPNSQQLSQRILALANHRIPFKATAGLHYPLRGEHLLSNQPDSGSAIMHGFLNVAILSSLANQKSITQDEANAILEASSTSLFQFTDQEIKWHDRSLSVAEIESTRRHFFRSFGSCSFQEPISDLHDLGLL